jgi:hypothetical protein
MVVHDFNINGITIYPDKTDSPLIVDSNTVLSLPVSTKCFQSVRQWNSQVVYRSSIVQHPELTPGDFVELSDSLDPADVSVLHKVVCCYPAPRELLGAVVGRTRGAIALTYPRGHIFSRLSNHLWNFVFWLTRSDFRSFVHDPGQVQYLIESCGFRRVFNQDSPMWHTQVFVAD